MLIMQIKHKFCCVYSYYIVHNTIYWRNILPALKNRSLIQKKVSFMSLKNKWSSNIYHNCFISFLHINVNKISTTIHVRITLISHCNHMLHVYKNWKKQWKHTVRINWLYGIYRKEYFLFFWERERECVWVVGQQRERERERS